MPHGYMTSSELVAAVKRKAAIPVNQNTFTEQDILDFANTEMKIGLVPTILDMHEEYYVTPELVALVSGQSNYGIPYRAIGGKLRDIKYVDPSSNLVDMSRIAPEDKARWLLTFSSYTAYCRYFYLEGNNICLLSNANATPQGSLLMEFYMRPNDLVTEDRVATIRNIAWDFTNNLVTFTVDQIPTGFATSTLLDVMQTHPGHRTYSYDLTPVAISTTNKTIQFTASDLKTVRDNSYAAVVIGDYISFAGECIIPQCPSDLHDVLAQRVAARCLDALGDAQGLSNANVKLQEMEQKSLPLIDNRVEGTPKKIVNKRSLIRNSKLNRFWWY